MIGLLIGKPLVDNNKLLVLIQGVGYQVNVGNTVLSGASQKEEITLYIHTHVREDALELYGFATAQEKDLFLLLREVSGVGPKTALSIADYGSDHIVEAVQTANVSFFTKIPRVGKKMAQKIIIELKSKLGSLKELKIGGLNEHEQMIVDAVTALGFDEQRIYEVLETVEIKDLAVEGAIKIVLKSIK